MFRILNKKCITILMSFERPWLCILKHYLRELSQLTFHRGEKRGFKEIPLSRNRRAHIRVLIISVQCSSGSQPSPLLRQEGTAIAFAAFEWAAWAPLLLVYSKARGLVPCADSWCSKPGLFVSSLLVAWVVLAFGPQIPSPMFTRHYSITNMYLP